MIPWILLSTKTVANIKKYVGLQLVKTGPKATPVRISFRIPLLCVAELRSLFELSESLSLKDIFSQTVGNNVIRPSNKIRLAESILMVSGWKLKEVIPVFRIRVNKTIERHKDPTIKYGGLRLSLFRLPPIITGNNGRTHGARIVRIPENKATRRSVIDMAIS